MSKARTPITALTEWPANTPPLTPSDLHQVVGVTLESAILAGITGTEVGLAGADMIEQHGEMVSLESRGDEAPHVLVATETTSKDHRLPAPRRR